MRARARAGIVVTVLLGTVAVAVAVAAAADLPIDGAKLVIKRHASGREQLVFVSKDPDALFAALGGADDPVSGVPGGASITVVSPVEGTSTLSIASGATDPGWTAHDGAVDTYRYRNSDAPGGPSLVRRVIFKQGRVIKIVASSTALAMTSAHGSIGIRIATGTLSNCALFDAATVVVDAPGRFIARSASGVSLGDCSDEALGEPQVCGDGDIDPGEQCDPPAALGGDATCRADCTRARCGDGTLDAGEQCDGDADCAGGQACSACCTCMDADCPDVLTLTMHAGTGLFATSTELDFGASGAAHDQDHLDGAELALRLCTASGAPPACGQAVIGGVVPSSASCRCANDNRTACDEPFALDVDDCGSASCECYLRPPEPSSAGNTPTCDLWKLAQDVGGTWNPDTGAGEIDAPVQKIRHTGETLTEPCPTCQGDVVANDGQRDGSCSLGENDGLPCDAHATDASFPAPGGGAYSYDCFPSSAKNVSGQGLRLLNVMTTGVSALPAAAVPCGIPPAVVRSCPCGSCSDDARVGCSSNADCAAGTCDVVGALMPSPCSDEVCTDAGGGEGVCLAGPTDKFCDAIVRANGSGFIACETDADCGLAAIGVDAGTCTLTQLRECFLDPVTAAGSPGSAAPTLVTTSCVAKGPGSGANALFGLPGPARARIATSAEYRCSGAPGSTYPGCP